MKKSWSNRILGSLLLAFVWMALTGHFSFGNFFVGFVFSSLSLWIGYIPEQQPISIQFWRIFRLIELTLFFLVELFKANLNVAHEVITPGFSMQPAIIAIPLDLKSDLGITILANMITLTPGTLSLDVSPQKNMLHVHAMYVKDVEAFRLDIKERFERRVMEVF